jgi:hypothetical protein
MRAAYGVLLCCGMRSVFLCAALSFCTGTAMAQGSSVGVLMVRAEVKPSAVLKLEARTPQLVISAADLARGYVEIPAAALLNLTAGKFRPLVYLDAVPLAAERGSYRFQLADKVTPGRRVVPVTLGIEL